MAERQAELVFSFFYSTILELTLQVESHLDWVVFHKNTR